MHCLSFPNLFAEFQLSTARKILAVCHLLYHANTLHLTRIPMALSRWKNLIPWHRAFQPTKSEPRVVHTVNDIEIQTLLPFTVPNNSAYTYISFTGRPIITEEEFGNNKERLEQMNIVSNCSWTFNKWNLLSLVFL